MRKIIIGMSGCNKCKTLKEQNPDIEYVEVTPDIVLPLARATGITSMPLIMCSGEPHELETVLKGE